MPSLQGLYAITDSQLMPDDDTLLTQVEHALRGGAAIVQYRDKSTNHTQRLRQAQALRQLCHDYQRYLLINDDIALARESQAHGVHLGQSDGSLAAARATLGKDAIIGITCHDQLVLAQQAEQEGADYVAFGAFYPSKTKPNASTAPLALLAEAKSRLSRPIVAIGGITVDNAPQTIQAGADMLAVIHALFSAPDIEQQAQRFVNACTTY